MITGEILEVRGGEVVVQVTFEPTDIDGSALTLPEWPAIDRRDASRIELLLKRLLSGEKAPGLKGRGTDGGHPVSLYQAFYPRTVAMYLHIIASPPAEMLDEVVPSMDTLYFWAEVRRILGSWGRKRPSSFDILARLEVRVMDLTEMTLAGVSHDALPDEGIGVVGLGNFT
jgi:hypothetical protein